MSTEVRSLAVYDRISDPMAAIKQLGHSIAHSGMFGCENEEQGQVLAMECLWSKVPPLSLKKRHHLIKGALSDRADWILAEFRRRGGKHRIIERTAGRAAIEMTLDGETQQFSFSWEDALQEPIPYQGKEKDVIAALAAGRKPEIKAKYATPRSRMQMLWARVVSDSVRAMCPEVVAGVYTPEEVHDFSGNGQGEPEADPNCTIVEVTSVSRSQSHSKPAEAPPFDPDHYDEPLQGGYGTAQQAQRILDLFASLQIPHEAQEAALQKRGAASLRSLTADQADELIAKLQARVDELEQSKADATVTSLPLTGPATQPQIDQVKQLIGEVAQNGAPDIAKRVKAKLESHGLQKLADLSMGEIGRLYEALKIRNLEAFFSESLMGHSAGGQKKN